MTAERKPEETGHPTMKGFVMMSLLFCILFSPVLAQLKPIPPADNKPVQVVVVEQPEKMGRQEWAAVGLGFVIAMWLSMKLLGYVQDRAGPEWEATCNWTRFAMFVLLCLVAIAAIIWLYLVPALTAVL